MHTSKLHALQFARDPYDAPTDRCVVVDVPAGTFLTMDGRGPASSPAFREALRAITDVSHALHAAAARRDAARARPEMPLEALWWWDEPSAPSPPGKRDWMWRLLIRQPAGVDQTLLDRARLDASMMGPAPLLSRVRLEWFHEGRAVQTMHLGPYRTELADLDRLHHDMRENGYVPAGKHHEIYLAENERTILRQPVRWTDETQA